MRAGVQTGDRIIKVKQSVSWESCGLQRLPRL
nr:Arhgef12 protein [Mus musculus]